MLVAVRLVLATSGGVLLVAVILGLALVKEVVKVTIVVIVEHIDYKKVIEASYILSARSSYCSSCSRRRNNSHSKSSNLEINVEQCVSS